MKRYVALLSACLLSLFLIACGSGGSSGPTVTSGGNTVPGGNGGGDVPPASPPSTTPTSTATLQSVNHIVFMLQENRSFDNYFGQLNAYRASLGLAQDADDLVKPLEPINPNPTHDGSTCPGSPNGTCLPYKMKSSCIEDLSPSWNEAHVDLTDNLSSKVQMNGFAHTAGGYAASGGAGASIDVAGKRAMGYYDSTQLNYYYFMATQFATSDRFFSPLLTKSEPNHLFGLAGTSQGWINVPTAQLSAPTIFNLLQKAGISWKVYYTDTNKATGKPDTYISYFSPMTPFLTDPTKLAPLSEYYTDLQNGTLPAVVLIDAGRDSGKDEHPLNNIVPGVEAAETVINAFMNSTAYNDGVFILTWDEGGGMYDHVPPVPAVNPDGIGPCIAGGNPVCADANVLTTFGDNFTLTGFRLPLIVVSPWAKSGFISHTSMDYTAILKFIETRFGLPNLTLRDQAQPDMTEFFDFVNTPNATPPSAPPVQVNMPCYYNTLP